MVQESPTAPQTQEGMPSPTAAPETPLVPSEAPATVAPEAEPPAPEPAEVPPAPEAPAPWAEKRDAYDVLDMPEFKEILTARDTRVSEQIQQDYQQRYNQATKEWESLQVAQSINGMVGGIISKLDGGDFEGADRALSKLEKFREPYSEPYEAQIQNTAAIRTADQFFGLMQGSLDLRAQDELVKARSAPGADWPSIFKKFSSLVKDGADKGGYHRGLKENRAAAAAQEPTPQGAGVLAPGSPAGGRSDRELQLDPTTPIEKLREIRARQGAGG